MKTKTLKNNGCFVFLLHRGICLFCAIFGRFWGLGRVFPLTSAFEGHAPLTVNTYMCIPSELKDDIYTHYLQKVHASSPLHGQIILQITQRSGVGAEVV